LTNAILAVPHMLRTKTVPKAIQKLRLNIERWRVRSPDPIQWSQDAMRKWLRELKALHVAALKELSAQRLTCCQKDIQKALSSVRNLYHVNPSEFYKKANVDSRKPKKTLSAVKVQTGETEQLITDPVEVKQAITDDFANKFESFPPLP